MIIPRKIPPEIWAWYNLKGDAMILVLHFVIAVILLALIELEVVQVFDWCPCPGWRSAHQSGYGATLPKDDDVMAEERRVAEQG